MEFVNRLKRLFGGRRGQALKGLEAFASQRKGVEGFIEPQTATNPVTLLLVDRDGDHARAPVREAKDAERFCKRLGVPVYDPRLVGYPRRMRDFEMGRRSDSDYVDQRIAEIERRFKEPGPEE